MSENRRWRRQIERKSRGGQGGFLKSVSPISVPARIWLETTAATQPPLSRAARLPCLLFSSRGRDWSQRSGVSGDGLKWLPARPPCGEPSIPTLMQVWQTTVGSGRGDTRVTAVFWETNGKETSEIDLWWPSSSYVKRHCGWTRKTYFTRARWSHTSTSTRHCLACFMSVIMWLRCFYYPVYQVDVFIYFCCASMFIMTNITANT